MRLRTHPFAKLFFLVTFTGLLMYIVLAFYSYHTAFSNTWKDDDTPPVALSDAWNNGRFAKDLKYILMWNFHKNWSNSGYGQEPFVKANCKYYNCYISANESMLSRDYSNFDAIVFNSFEANPKLRPRKRKQSQKYIYFNKVPSEEFPLCNVHADGFFNWTWSYKLYSDILSPFIEVRNKKYDIYVAPNRVVDWSSQKVSQKIDIEQFEGKKKSVAWYADRCHTRNNRMKAVLELSEHLQEHNMTVDIFGKCGKPCPNGTFEGCKELFRKDYYFVLAYEESFSEDYVTKEVLTAYDSLAIPIVSGKNDYRKFLPPGSYIDSEQFTTEDLAAKIVYTLRNPSIYHHYFRWTEHYLIREYDPIQAACSLCSLLNSEEASRYSVYDNLRTWWYSIGSLRDKCLPFDFEVEYESVAKKMGLTNESRPVGDENAGSYAAGGWLDNAEETDFKI